MKILITGGDGFIAQHLKEQLKSKYIIEAPNSRELNLLDANAVQNYVQKRSVYFDLIIHAATYDAAAKNSAKKPEKVLENNLRMFFNLERCKKWFGKMYNLGSGAEFGRENRRPHFIESDFGLYVPTDPYGYSKYLMTKYIYANPTNIYNLRLFAVFGEYENWRGRFISNACCRTVLNMPILIHQDVFFDFLYITDLIRIIDWFIEHPRGLKEMVYNICTGHSHSLISVARKILSIENKSNEIIIQKDGLGKEYSGNNHLLMHALGEFSFTPFPQAIEKVYNWYKDNIHLINKNEL